MPRETSRLAGTKRLARQEEVKFVGQVSFISVFE